MSRSETTTWVRAAVLVFFVCSLSSAVRAQNFCPWNLPVHVGVVNTPVEDYQPYMTKDALSLYFVRIEGGVNHLYVSKRATAEDAWGTPELLPATINQFGAGGPLVTTDGHRMYFAGARPDSIGGEDIYVSWRQNKKVESGPGGWQPPVNLGPNVNSGVTDQTGAIFEDELTGNITMYFASNRFGSLDIFASEMQPDGTFGPAEPVSELNTGATEQQPTISHNGRELYFVSNRPGSIKNLSGGNSLDIWTSTRASTSDSWSDPVNVTVLNSKYHDGRPALSWDESQIYFFSANRTEDCLSRGECNISNKFDIWMSTREKDRSGCP